MKVLDYFTLVLLIGLFAFGIYVLYDNYPREPRDYGVFSARLPEVNSTSLQFYPNMRYKDSRISYWINPECGSKKTGDMEEAIGELSSSSVLKFYSVVESDAEISITCSNLSPEPVDKNHFVAGEGGPVNIVNTTIYSVILSGKIALYRSERCSEPRIALHELLHALGFDHNNNPNSIMYPVTDCRQTLDSSIIDEISRLYRQPSEVDLLIDSVSAGQRGKYLDFNAVVANYGLMDSSNVTLEVLSKGKLVKSFDVGDLPIGVKKILDVKNVRFSGSGEISFSVSGDSPELSYENNVANLSLIER